MIYVFLSLLDDISQISVFVMLAIILCALIVFIVIAKINQRATKEIMLNSESSYASKKMKSKKGYNYRLIL